MCATRSTKSIWLRRLVKVKRKLATTTNRPTNAFLKSPISKVCIWAKNGKRRSFLNPSTRISRSCKKSQSSWKWSTRSTDQSMALTVAATLRESTARTSQLCRRSFESRSMTASPNLPPLKSHHRPRPPLKTLRRKKIARRVKAARSKSKVRRITLKSWFARTVQQSLAATKCCHYSPPMQPHQTSKMLPQQLRLKKSKMLPKAQLEQPAQTKAQRRRSPFWRGIGVCSEPINISFYLTSPLVIKNISSFFYFIYSILLPYLYHSLTKKSFYLH